MLAEALAVGVVLSQALPLALGIITVVEGPAFEKKEDQFDLRYNGGHHVTLISSKPSIVWEEPEAYFPVSTEIRVQTTLGYRVELMS
jgi:hypothetical protein